MKTRMVLRKGFELTIIGPIKTLVLFLNENDSLAYFAVLGESVVRLVFFFKTLSFRSLLLAFSGGKEGHTWQHPNVLVDLRRPNIRGEIFWTFHIKFERHTSQRRLSQNLRWVHVKYVLHKGAFMSKTVATFVQKVGSIWLKGGFLLQLFRTQM